MITVELSLILEQLDPKDEGTSILRNLVTIYQSTRCKAPEDFHLHQYCHKDFQSGAMKSRFL